MAPVVAPPAGRHGISVAERAALASQHQVVERAHVGVVPHHLGVALGLDDHRVTAPEAPPALLDAATLKQGQTRLQNVRVQSAHLAASIDAIERVDVPALR